MKDFGLGEQHCISEIGVSEPFPLFTADAVMQARNEVLSDEVWGNCKFANSISACPVRVMIPKCVFIFPCYISKDLTLPRYAKFVYDPWTHLETVRTISAIAGVDLVPVMHLWTMKPGTSTSLLAILIMLDPL